MSYTKSRTVFAATSNAERRDHDSAHYAAFVHEWLPMARVDLDANLLNQHPQFLIELYAPVYSYGPHGMRWLAGLNRAYDLATNPAFLADLHRTFYVMFSDWADGYHDAARADRIVSVLNDMRSGARTTHRHGTDYIVNELVNGSEVQHPVYKLVKRAFAKLGDPFNVHLGSIEQDEMRDAIEHYCYFYLLQDVCQQGSLREHTAPAFDFLERWKLA